VSTCSWQILIIIQKESSSGSNALWRKFILLELNFALFSLQVNIWSRNLCQISKDDFKSPEGLHISEMLSQLIHCTEKKESNLNRKRISSFFSATCVYS
jgi:hypothetical protein